MDSANINRSLNNLFDNKTFSTTASLVLALYAGAAAPALPNSIIRFFDTVVCKLVFIFLIGYVSTKNMQLALMMSIAFVVSLNIVNTNMIRENFSSCNREKEEFKNHKDMEHDNTEHDDMDHNDNDEQVDGNSVPEDEAQDDIKDDETNNLENNRDNDEDESNMEDVDNFTVEPFVPTNNLSNLNDKANINNNYAPF